MKHSLMAVAIGGAFAWPGIALAQAPSSVQLYGGLDLSVMNYRLNASGTTPSSSKWALYNSGLRTIFGIRGQEGLGGGMTVWFQAESTLFAEGRQNAATQPAINFGGRNSGLGLRGGFGDVMVGQWDSPYKLNTYPVIIPSTLGFASVYGSILGNVNGVGNADTTGSVPNPNCQNLPTNAALSGTNPLCGATEASTTGFVRRLSDTLQYWSPVFGGAQFKIATQLPESKIQSGTNAGQNPTLWSTSLAWTGGPLSVAVAYELHSDFQFNGGKDNAWSVSAAYTFAPGMRVAAYYEQLNTDGPASGFDVNARNFGVMGTFGVGAGEVIAAYAKARDPSGPGVGSGLTNAPAVDAGGNVMILGYKHHLSKRTNVYAVYYKINNDSGATRVALGAPTNAGGASSAVAAGQDTTAFGVGMAHSF